MHQKEPQNEFKSGIKMHKLLASLHSIPDHVFHMISSSRVYSRRAGRAPRGDPSFEAATGGEHRHQRPPEGAAGEEACRVGERHR